MLGADAAPSQVCSNEGKCICQPEWTGKDCSVYDPIPEPKPTGETERYKGQCALCGGSHHVPSSLPTHPRTVPQLGTAGSLGCPVALSLLICVPVLFSLAQVPVAPISLLAPSLGPCWWLPLS